ncbi:MAG: phosphoribosylformylglycinamidine synthase subunit PurL [Sandaracinaceae bacterium]|nr:phosphoribosylformylglycinamidine synthase subunit PurL [Sandaracinaceae bacterium]
MRGGQKFSGIELITTSDQAENHGLTQKEWEYLIGLLGRFPTLAELGVISAMWSEHCSYKSSKNYLKLLPTQGPRVVQGPGENAGAVDIGDGFVAVFKIESHNHPSFIEPYQGAATGVGGILRDVFTMGARPVALLNSLRFGDPKLLLTRRLLQGVVKGISGYGNAFGVPTVGGELFFDPSYNQNCLVNVFALGIARRDRLLFGRGGDVGNRVFYLGAPTGRDGIHGATMASAGFDQNAHSKLPTVQVADPFRGKLLLEACLEIFGSGAAVGAQDMGAAGLTSSSVEVAARAQRGIEIDLDRVPRRASGMTPYEVLLSESQERMLVVAAPGKESVIKSICQKWDIECAEIGEVTDSGRFVCKATIHPDTLPSTEPPKHTRVVDLPILLFSEHLPRYSHPEMPPPPYERREEHLHQRLRSMDGSETLIRLLSSPNIGSRRWVFRQFDHMVRVGTVIRPGEGDAAVIRVFCPANPSDPEMKDALIKYLAISVDGNARFVALDPLNGGAMAVAECLRNIVCVGAEPIGLTDCLNFGSPLDPKTMWQFGRAVEGIAMACTHLRVPVVSGNVSLYNETDGQPILPTPIVGAVGILRSPDDCVPMAFAREGDLVVHLGPPSCGVLGGSEIYVHLTGGLGGNSPRIDLDMERRLQDALLEMARTHLIRSAHDISDGGMGVALAECAIGLGIGARVHLPQSNQLDASSLSLLFAEEPTRVIISLPPESLDRARSIAQAKGVPMTVIGKVGGDRLVVDGLVDVSLGQLLDAYESALGFLEHNADGY